WRRFGDDPRSILFVPTRNFVDSRVLRHSVDGLRDQFRLLTFDARGSGSSDHPATGYGFDRHAADAVAVLDATGTTPASLVAASLGANTAVFLAATQPELIDGMVLIQPSIELAKEDSEGNTNDPQADRSTVEASAWETAPDWKTDYANFVQWFIAEVFPEPDSQQTIDEVVGIALEAEHGMLLRQSAELDWTQAAHHFADIRCPTLVIHGMADRTAYLASSQAITRAIAGAQLMPLAGLGHRPDIRRPDVVNRLLAAFLDPAPSGSSAQI
ncbi:MAG: alpha/beta hydrolase, partial [Dehalococcoidia bacterium]